jgi:DNA-binding IclR family transcriptional regulator
VTTESQHVPAAERTIRLLETLADAPGGLTTSELMDEVDGSRSGLYALINTLRAHDFVASDEGRHRLGPAIWGLLPDRPRELQTLLTAFAEETRAHPVEETIAVTWPEGGRPTVAAEASPDRSVRVVYRPGAPRPAGSTDVLVMEAGGPGDDGPLPGVRRTGIAVEASEEMTEIAVPVCADGTHPTAALVGGIPSGRATDHAVETLARTLRQLAARLSHRLGAAVYQPYGWVGTEPVGPSRDLEEPELDQFLRGLWGAQLACVRSDGTPHVIPLWYEWDGEVMWLAASPGASWRSYIADNPRVSVTLDEPWPPLRRVFLAGEAAEVADSEVPGGLGGLRRRLAVRYLGRGADQSPELQETEGWAAVRIVPDRIHGRQGLGAVAI